MAQPDEEAGRPLGLVADIGGTNARFALIDARGGLHGRLTLASADYPGLEDAIEDYARRIPAARSVRRAVVALAAPVTGRVARMTNGRWFVDADALEASGRFARVDLVNDFAAIGWGLPDLLAGFAKPLGPLPTPVTRAAPIAVLGPGTGLGVAVRLPGPPPAVLATEAGHVSFAAETEREHALAAELASRHGRVSVERLVSGPGLATLYRHLGGDPARRPADISAAARTSDDPLAREAADWFLDLLARFAGDMALAHGAWGGVALTGGVWQALHPLADGVRFRRRFVAKGRYRELLERVPIHVVTHPDPGLFGAVALLRAPCRESRPAATGAVR